MKSTRRIMLTLVLAALFLAGLSLRHPSELMAKSVPDCKSLCSAALKATGGSQYLKYKSTSAIDFGALSYSARNKVKAIQYVCDSKEVYSLCVMQASNKSGAKTLHKQLKKYIKNNKNSMYLSDYSSSEQKVFKNAVCGRKGSVVWYIAMSAGRAENIKGQKAIKGKL